MDNDTIKKLTHLSKLTIPDDDIEELKTNLENILNLISDIDAAPTEDMVPMAHPLDFSQPLRDDKSDDAINRTCLLYTSPSPRDMRRSRMPSSA